MAVGALYLVDKSAWEQARYSPAARERLLELRAGGRLAACVVSLAEMLYSAQNAAEVTRITRDLATLAFLHMTPAAEGQVPELVSLLAGRGQHRMPVPDLLLAAIAAANSAVVLHYYANFERIAEVTGQPHEWIVPRGTGHGSVS